MPFENGSFAFSAFRLPKDFPENEAMAEKLVAKAAGRLSSLGEDEEVGWVGWRHLLEIQLDEGNTTLGYQPFFTLRRAMKKIPAALLKAECRMKELLYMQEHNVLKVPSKKKKEIKEETIADRLPAMPPAIGGFQVVIDRHNQMCFISTTSASSISLFVELFTKTFDFEPYLIEPTDILQRHLQKSLTDLPVLKFGAFPDEEYDFPGRDFLTWLWYFSETNEGGKLKIGDQTVQVSIDGPLSLICASELGAGETALRKGMPTRSAEVKAALNLGKKLRKAKLMIASEETWALTFDADKFACSGVILPEGDELDFAARFDDRIEKTVTLVQFIEGYFVEYAKIMMDENQRKKLESEIQKWIQNREEN